MLFSVSPTEPSVYGATVAVMVAVALTAAWLPARRAANLDPLVVLWHE